MEHDEYFIFYLEIYEYHSILVPSVKYWQVEKKLLQQRLGLTSEPPI